MAYNDFFREYQYPIKYFRYLAHNIIFFNRISFVRCNEKGAIHVTHKPLDGGDTRSRTKSAMVKIRVRKSAAGLAQTVISLLDQPI